MPLNYPKMINIGWETIDLDARVLNYQKKPAIAFFALN